MSALGERVGEALAAADHEIASRWLERLESLVPEERRAILPGPQLLDHVPDLVRTIAGILGRRDARFETRTSTTVLAEQLGRLRHRQGASLHQLLREFEILGEVLDEWLVDQAAGSSGDDAAWISLTARLHAALTSWMRLSADAFAHGYAEDLRRERNAVRDLHRAVDHEMRTPMGTIANAAGLMEDDGVAAMIRRSLDQMGDTLAMLGRDLWRSAADTAVAIQDCDLRGVVEDVLSRLHDSAASRDVELRMGGRFEQATLDVGSLDLALVNLVSNGIKYARPEAGARYVEIVGAGDSDEVVLEVRDNGIGIPPEAQERIFERGFRAHRDRDAQLGVDGDGLGLYLVKGSVGSLGGRLEVDSEPGTGTRFRLVLPRKQQV